MRRLVCVVVVSYQEYSLTHCVNSLSSYARFLFLINLSANRECFVINNVPSLKIKKSPARSRALRDVSTYAEECGTTPYDLFRALSHHEISAYPASHTGKQTGDSSRVPCFWHSRRPNACSLAPDRVFHSQQCTHRQGSSQSAGGLEYGAVRRAAAGQRA